MPNIKTALHRWIIAPASMLRTCGVRRTIRGKILVATLGMCLITGALGAYAVSAINQAAGLVLLTFDNYLMSINFARAAAFDFSEMEKNFVRRQVAQDQAVRQELDHAIAGQLQTMEEDLAIAATRSRSARAARAASKVLQAAQDWDRARTALPVSGAGWDRLDDLSGVVSEQIDLLINYAAGDAFIHRERALKAIGSTRRFGIIGTLAALLLSVAVTWVLARRIIGPVAAASAAAERIARGELETEIPAAGDDELGALLAAMDRMRNNICQMMAREVAQRRSAQARLVDAIETSPEGVLLVDNQGLIALANTQLRNFFPDMAGRFLPGNPAADVAPALPLPLPLPLAQPAPLARPEECLRNGRWLRINSGSTTEGGIVTFVSDVSPLKAREAELRETNVHFDAALNNMSQGLCLFDSDQRLRVVNRRFCELYGLSSNCITPGMTLRDVVEQIVRRNTACDLDADEIFLRRAATAARQQPEIYLEELLEGRILTISHEPMPDGGWVATYDDVTERRRAEAQIAFMAHHDVLTSLPNRVLFQEKMAHAINDLTRGRHFAVLCLDLDRFKVVNDTLGHPAGDHLLQLVAERLRMCVRETDTIARLGGDEFAIIQSNSDRPEDSAQLAERIIADVSRPYDLDGQQVMIGVSVGIAVAPSDGTIANTLLRNADMALYRAKIDGRGTFRFFEPDMDERAQVRRALELDLRLALPNDELELYFQPVVDLSVNRVTGFEALIRWQHPVRGMVPPSEFIPLAEEVGLIAPIGKWVLQKACMEAATWPHDVRVAVNVSAVQFTSQDLVETVRDALSASGLAKSRLELEITESVLMQNDTAMTTLHRLRALGVRIAMDDFGTGYSSLSYLRSFPFDKIKIDQSFVRDLSTRKDSEAIVCAITTLGISLGMRTTAEGVETEEQLERLRSERCNEVQGYFFSKPRPATEVPHLLAEINERIRARETVLEPV